MVSSDSADILKQLEINFSLALNDLDFASHELDCRMKDGAKADVSIPDLHTLHHRIRAIKAEMPKVVKDATGLENDRKEIEAALNASLIENYKVMVGLYARLGVSPDPDWVATAGDVAKLMPAPLTAPRDCGAEPSESFVSDCEGERLTESTAGDEIGGLPPSRAAEISMSASRVEEKVVKQSPAVIFEEDFLAVHTNTRGRAKLQDVRKVVYAKVREDYEEKMSLGRPGCKPAPINKKELDAMGLKVFGLTGDCILNTLRAMGLITVSKGSVSIASD
ncbi:unnamed protein product [Scytosiphon promiscuus]